MTSSQLTLDFQKPSEEGGSRVTQPTVDPCEGKPADAPALPGGEVSASPGQVFVRVQYESDRVDERSGERFRWQNVLDVACAEAHVAAVNRGDVATHAGRCVRAWIGAA
jgi:hypothetical protein